MRLRTKFLVSMLVISSGLACTALLSVRHNVQEHVRKTIFADLRNSTTTFQNFQRHREATLVRSAELLANLPILRALMTTRHAPTIQDASRSLWRLAGSDLLVLADHTGKVVALHIKTPGFGRDLAEESLRSGLYESQERGHWWFGARQLYEVFVMPIYFGTASENRLLGFLAVGYEVDGAVLHEMRSIASGEVAFRCGDTIAISTLPAQQEAELLQWTRRSPTGEVAPPVEIKLGQERFLATSVELAQDRVPVSLIVVKSYDQATSFLDELNRLLLGLGLVAVVGGSVLVFLISHTFTKPLGELVSGVRALGQNNFSYPLEVRGNDEVADLTAAFDEMRRALQKNRRELLDAERLAMIGRMASSISHDLRHSLAAIFANAEFLREEKLTAEQREELYHEIRIAVDRMTDLLDSLLELSWSREALRTTFGEVGDAVDKAVQAVRAHPEFHRLQFSVSRRGKSEGWFDPKKLERALYNLLLNACEVVSKESGRVEVELMESPSGVEIRVRDNGPGIADSIRDHLFEPFVSHGKENGSGLGLAVAQKIIQDHGGEISVEQTSEGGTVFRLVLPVALPPEDGSSSARRKIGARLGAGTKPVSFT